LLTGAKRKSHINKSSKLRHSVVSPSWPPLARCDAQWPDSVLNHSTGASMAPKGAFDRTLKCDPSECYHGSHLRGSAIIGRWPGLRGGGRTLRAAVFACCAVTGLAGCASGTSGSQSTVLPDRTVSAPVSTAAGNPQVLARQAYLGMWQRRGRPGADLTRRAERSVRRRGPTDGPPPGTRTAPGRAPRHPGHRPPATRC
jgi:hypothetical protein